MTDLDILNRGVHLLILLLIYILTPKKKLIYIYIYFFWGHNSHDAGQVRMAEWSKALDSSSGPRERAWVQIPLLTFS